jgi:hypothetical protein
MFGELNMQVVVLTLLYSWAGLGIAIVNDFKSVSHSSCIKRYDCMPCYRVHHVVCILSGLTAALALVHRALVLAVLTALDCAVLVLNSGSKVAATAAQLSKQYDTAKLCCSRAAYEALSISKMRSCAPTSNQAQQQRAVLRIASCTSTAVQIITELIRA